MDHGVWDPRHRLYLTRELDRILADLSAPEHSAMVAALTQREHELIVAEAGEEDPERREALRQSLSVVRMAVRAEREACWRTYSEVVLVGKRRRWNVIDGDAQLPLWQKAVILTLWVVVIGFLLRQH